MCPPRSGQQCIPQRQLLQDFAVLFCRVVARGDQGRIALVKSIAADRRLGLLPPCEVPSCSNDIAANDSCRTIALGAQIRQMAKAQAFPPQTARAACEAMLENMHAAGALENEQHAAGELPWDFCFDAVRLSSEALATLTNLRAAARLRIVVRSQAYCRGVLTRKYLSARASGITRDSSAQRAAEETQNCVRNAEERFSPMVSTFDKASAFGCVLDQLRKLHECKATSASRAAAFAAQAATAAALEVVEKADIAQAMVGCTTALGAHIDFAGRALRQLRQNDFARLRHDTRTRYEEAQALHAFVQKLTGPPLASHATTITSSSGASIPDRSRKIMAHARESRVTLLFKRVFQRTHSRVNVRWQ